MSGRLAAEVGGLAFSVAFERWMKAAANKPFAPIAVMALNDLQSRAADL